MMLFCDCSNCENAPFCYFKDKYQRLPREFYPGALGLCPKLKSREDTNHNDEKI